MIRCIFFLVLIAGVAKAQTLTEPRQKAINNFIQYTNHLTTEMQGLGPSLTRFYRDMMAFRKSKSRPIPEYGCRIDAKSYYYDEAIKTVATLGPAGAQLQAAVESARKSFSGIDETCKAIEIYFRLKDYQSDNFARFESLISTLEKAVLDYHEKVMRVEAEVIKLVQSLQPYQPASAYHQADRLLRNQLTFERELLDSWTFNVAEDIHSGWPHELAQKHVLEDSKKISALQASGISLKYPASSMFSSFISSTEALQQTKKAGVDGYIFEKQQSDKFSNDLYYDLINYYNNAVVSFYNHFISQSGVDGFRGVYALNFVPRFGVRTTVKEIKIEITPFQDKQVPELRIAPTTGAIPAPLFSCLTNYVNFMNECTRQIDNMVNPIHNLNTSAAHGKARMKTGNRVTIDYYYKSLELPVTLYQQMMEQSKSLPASYQKTLVSQAETLYGIMTEINQWNNLLLKDAATKQLALDSLNHVYRVIGRFKDLMDAYDVRKNHLYADVRAIFEAYKPVNAKSSWVVSGKGMLTLLDENYKQLAISKNMLFSDTTLNVNTQEIQRLSRELIVNEFTNLTGIEKLGRSNGNCPYSPYEDLPKYSLLFGESLLKAKNRKVSGYYRHPYNELVHLYNQNLVDEYNRFAGLSKAPLLPVVDQLQLYEIVPPEKPKPAPPPEPVVQPVAEVYVPEKQPVTQPEKLPEEAKQKGKRKQDSQPIVQEQTKGGVIHDTVRITDIIRIETIRQDTVYVSKVDTVYVGVPGENMMSMEGYATNNMVLLLDVSGSMNNPDKLPLLKKSVLLLLKMMRAEDEVSIITYSGKAKVELQPTSFKEEDKITKVIERLKSEGKTDGNAGITLAYAVADKNYIRGGNNRIILATDGEFPISKETFDLVKKFAGEDIFITVFNFGKSAGSAKNLQQLAVLGKGNYEFITRENVDSKLIKEVKAKRKR